MIDTHYKADFGSWQKSHFRDVWRRENITFLENESICGNKNQPIDKKIYDSFQSVDRLCHAWESWWKKSCFKCKGLKNIHFWFQRFCCFVFTLMYNSVCIRTKSICLTISLTNRKSISLYSMVVWEFIGSVSLNPSHRSLASRSFWSTGWLHCTPPRMSLKVRMDD